MSGKKKTLSTHLISLNTGWFVYHMCVIKNKTTYVYGSKEKFLI